MVEYSPSQFLNAGMVCCGRTVQGGCVETSMAGVKMLLVSGDVCDNKRRVGGSA